jgi:hypothetical protein
MLPGCVALCAAAFKTVRVFWSMFIGFCDEDKCHNMVRNGIRIAVEPRDRQTESKDFLPTTWIFAEGVP